MAENCNTTVAFHVGQRGLAHYSHCARLTASLPGEERHWTYRLDAPIQLQLDSLNDANTAAPCDFSCLLQKRCSFCKAFQAKIGISYSITAQIMLPYSLLLMTSQPPPPGKALFKVYKLLYCFFSVLLLLICSFQLASGQSHIRTLSMIRSKQKRNCHQFIQPL